MVLRNVKKRNKQYSQVFLVFCGTILAEWCSSNLDKILEKTCEGVYFFSEAAEQKSTALLKNYVLHSYFRIILLKVWVIPNCTKATVTCGDKRSYAYT